MKGVSNWNFNVSDLKKQADMEHLDPVPEATAGAACLASLDLGSRCQEPGCHKYSIVDQVPRCSSQRGFQTCLRPSHVHTTCPPESTAASCLVTSWHSLLEYCPCPLLAKG